MTLWVTAVIHFKTLVTRSSPKSLYLTENVDNTHAIHSSPTRHLFRVTSELALQLILYQYDIPFDGDEWVTSETKRITVATHWHIKLYNDMGDELTSSMKILFLELNSICLCCKSQVIPM